MKIQTENLAGYAADNHDDTIVAQALQILRRRLDRADSPVFTSPGLVRDYLTLRVAGLEHEVFGVLWLDTQHRLIEAEELFRGTIDQGAVYPREVAKAALARNASAVVLYHNHPSGHAEPSRADQTITKMLKDALALIGVRTLDHIIVTAEKTLSFAERGLL